MESTIREWLANPRGNALLGPFYSGIETQSRKTFGGGEDNKRAIGMDIMDMLNDMPLVSVPMFQQEALPMHAEEIVKVFLAQVHSMDENIPA